jgi:hypothetical protein
MTDQRLSNIRKRSGFEKFYTILKFFGGGLVFLISFVGEFGSSTNISFRYMMSNPKFPNIKHPETIGKFFELFAVSVVYRLDFSAAQFSHLVHPKNPQFNMV